jgi:hypothetical protein
VSTTFGEAAAATGSQKKKVKKVKSSMKLQNVFRRVSQAGRSHEEDQRKEQPAGQLFGRQLSELTSAGSVGSGEDGTISLPQPVVVSFSPLSMWSNHRGPIRDCSSALLSVSARFILLSATDNCGSIQLTVCSFTLVLRGIFLV